MQRVPLTLLLIGSWLAFVACKTPDVNERGELLVATPSSACTAKQCPGQCCNVCGPVVWKLASDPGVQVIAPGVVLPEVIATECGLHYDLRAEGARKDDRFVVRTFWPVPSKRGRVPGTQGQLEVQLADGEGECTAMDCEEECCNMCYSLQWRPKPTLDVIEWSGALRLPSSAMDCNTGPRAVTGTWLGRSTFEITIVRESKRDASP